MPDWPQYCNQRLWLECRGRLSRLRDELSFLGKLETDFLVL